MSRLRDFLPQMEKANEDLMKRIEEGENVAVEIDDDDDDDANDDEDGEEAKETLTGSIGHESADLTSIKRKMAIEMTLGLFERNEESSSDDDEEEEEEDEEDDEEEDDSDPEADENATDAKKKSLIVELS